MLKIGLISLYVIESNGIRYLASSLRQAGFTVDEIYFGHFYHHYLEPPSEPQVRRLIDLLKERKIGLVGLSLRAGAYLEVAKNLTRRIKDELGIPVMWGGAHVTLSPEQCLDNADFLLMGEAEYSIVEVARSLDAGKDFAHLSGVWTRRDGQVQKNTLPPLIQDLDKIPFPDFVSSENKFWIYGNRMASGEPLKHERIFRIIASRGCLYNCSFCGVSAFRRLYEDGEKFYRLRSVENCIEELEQARRTFKRLRRIRFDDELFVPHKDWLERFAAEYPKRIGMPFDILSNPKCLDEWTVSTLAKAGMDSVFLGVQGPASTNERFYNRYVADEKVTDTAHRLKRHKVRGMFQVLIDDPMTPGEEKHRLLDLLLALPRTYDLFIYSLCHWPGSVRTKELLEQGVISADQVEGLNNKVLRQFNADFAYQRGAEDTFYLALYILSSKRVVPRFLIRRLEKSGRLRRHPRPLVALAIILNIVKLFTEGFRLLLRGEISMYTVRRWLHKQNPFTLPSI